MSLENPSFREENTSTTLNEKQKSVVDSVLKTLENAEFNKKITGVFSEMFAGVAANDEQFAKLMEKAGLHENAELATISKSFEKGDMDGNMAKEVARKTIQKYTKIELLALRKQYEVTKTA